MNRLIHRKQFLALSGFGTAALLFSNSAKSHQQKPAAIDGQLVKEFVGKSHGDLNRVKELLAKEPGLLNCSWDWGGGDFETGLEAAGHVGNREIAHFLLDNGARMNIFCAAMLGELEIVKAMLTAFPDLKNSKGPHGLQLLHHARKGGEHSKQVLSFLESIAAK